MASRRSQRPIRWSLIGLESRLSVVAGAAQVAWILAQVAILRRFFFLQPVMLVAGLAVVALAVLAHQDERPTPSVTFGSGRSIGVDEQ